MCEYHAMSQSTESGSPLDWDLVDRLHKSLRVSGVSVAEMAEELGVHRNTVTNYLSGRVKPDRRTLIVWALKAGLPLTWLEKGRPVTGGSDPDGGGTAVTRALLAQQASVVTLRDQSGWALAPNRKSQRLAA